MKNYAMDKNNSKTFIKCYTKKDDNIIVQYGSGEKRVLSDCFESQILSQMESQVSEEKFNGKVYKSLATVCRREKIKDFRSSGSILFTCMISDPFLLDIILGKANFKLLDISCLALSTALTVYSICNLIISNNFINDIEKNIFFIKNKNILNQYALQKDIVKIKKNTKSKLEQGMNINSIDKLSYKELKKLKEQLEQMMLDDECEKVNIIEDNLTKNKRLK